MNILIIVCICIAEKTKVYFGTHRSQTSDIGHPASNNRQ